jgi:hypothetical protein
VPVCCVPISLLDIPVPILRAGGTCVAT